MTGSSPIGKGRKRRRVLAVAFLSMAGPSAQAATFMSLADFVALTEPDAASQEATESRPIKEPRSVEKAPNEDALDHHTQPEQPVVAETPEAIPHTLLSAAPLETAVVVKPAAISPAKLSKKLPEELPKTLSEPFTEESPKESKAQPVTRLDVLKVHEPERTPPELGPDFQGFQPYDGAATTPGFDNTFISLMDGKIDIGAAVRRSIDFHPDIAQAIGRLFQSSEQVAVARSGYFPQVSSGIRGGYRSSTGRSEEAFTVSASQMLYDFGKVSSSVEVAASALDRERAGVLLSVDQLARETAQAVIDIQRYVSLMEVADDQIDALGELKDLAAQRAAKGAATRSDEVQAQSRQEAARAMRLQFKAQLDVGKRSLQSLLGTDTPIDVSLDFPEPLPQACVAASEDFAATPEIMMAEAQRAEAQATIRQARSRMLPTLSLNAGYEHYLDRPANDIAVNNDEDFTVTLSLTSDLFQGGALRASRRAANHALETATAARDAAYLSVTKGLREARDQSISLAARSAILQDQYQSIVETQELYRQQYLSLGTRTLLDILNTEQEIHQSRFDRINTMFDLRRLQIDCLYHVGGIRDAFGLSSSSVRGVNFDDVK